ncbi:MAG: hypothetical protein IJ190_12185 [Prevotella sp.]|nr:hypothetical protein [Prevotella sp.]
MKKTLLILFALVGGVVASSATEVIVATDVNDGASLKIAAIKDAGGIDTDIVTFYFKDDSGTDHTGWGMGGFAKSSEWSTLDESFTGDGTSWTSSYTVARIKEVADTEVGIRIRLYNGAVITKIVVNATLTFAEPRTITYDGGGLIAASEFDGLADTDQIRFTYTVTGDLTGYENWGIGSIGSTDDPHSVKIADLPASALGDLTYTCYYADIKPALVATPDGILFKTWNFNSGQATATRKKVEILKSCVPVTFGDGKTLISYSPSSGIQLDVTDVDGLKAYVVSSVTKTSVELAETKGIRGSNLGFILEGTAGATYNIPVVDDALATGGNYLSGTGESTKTVGDNEDVYILSNGKFCLFTGATIPAHKAYLPASYVPAPDGARDLEIVIDGLSTGIKNIKVGSEDNIYYDLSGRRVLYPTKGLYIVNGKKVVIK